MFCFVWFQEEEGGEQKNRRNVESSDVLFLGNLRTERLFLGKGERSEEADVYSLELCSLGRGSDGDTPCALGKTGSIYI